MAASTISNLRRGKFITQDHAMDELQFRGSEIRSHLCSGDEKCQPEILHLKEPGRFAKKTIMNHFPVYNLGANFTN
jgi:hypothetical protein